jgi:LmbE family N-acetylglucosaminyl deacetylase
MPEALKLMYILAHPDDETLGSGGVLAKYAAQGVETYLITATRGEGGWRGTPEQDPGPQAVGEIRERELMCAAQALGIHEVYLLGYIDGHLAEADHQEVVARIVPYLRAVCPQVVVTFDPFGVYGHTDHIAIAQSTVAAVVQAANPHYQVENDLPTHQVDKLYYHAESENTLAAFQAAMGEMQYSVNGQPRGMVGWKEWAATTRIDTTGYWEQVVEAVRCHASQQLNPDGIAALPQHSNRRAILLRNYYRVFSLVNGGSEIEDDLFAGLRQSESQPPTGSDDRSR